MAKAEFTLLAHDFDPKKHLASGAFLSEKLDGFRCIWDGGISRGMLKKDVPWANLDKDKRYKKPQLATGLWSRYGNIIHAPDWFLDELPVFMTDGELWIGKQRFEECRSIASRLPENRNDFDWDKIKYKIFDIPRPEAIFGEREINTNNFKIYIHEFCLSFALEKLKVIPKAKSFQNVITYLKANLKENEVVQLHEQEQLPFSTDEALERISQRLDEVTDQGGEGLMLRRPMSIWIPERSHDLVKIKKLKDDEATVVGYTTGRRTGKGSKLQGLMGAMIVNWNGKKFELSGFTDEERILSAGDEKVHITSLRIFEGITPKDMWVEPKAFAWAMENPSPDNGPGTLVPDWINHPLFPRGSVITFRYRDVSNDGIPKEAKYWRKHGSY